MLQLAAHRENINRIQVRVQDDVASYLLNRKRQEINRLEEGGDLQVTITSATGVSPEMLHLREEVARNSKRADQIDKALGSLPGKVREAWEKAGSAERKVVAAALRDAAELRQELERELDGGSPRGPGVSPGKDETTRWTG